MWNTNFYIIKKILILIFFLFTNNNKQLYYLLLYIFFFVNGNNLCRFDNILRWMYRYINLYFELTTDLLDIYLRKRKKNMRVKGRIRCCLFLRIYTYTDDGLFYILIPCWMFRNWIIWLWVCSSIGPWNLPSLFTWRPRCYDQWHRTGTYSSGSWTGWF